MDDLNELYGEYFEERAAIREFDGEQSRGEAELAAREETKLYVFQCMIRLLITWKNEGKRADVVAWLDKCDAEKRKRFADTLNEQIKLGNAGGMAEWK